MTSSAPISVESKEGRFARLEAIEWWDQALLARSRVLVVGAGALGNEIIKNLALLGLGHVVIADLDRVELSNLSRSVLFREADEGRSKAECAARSAREIYPAMQVRPWTGNVLAGLGFGYFRWADVVLGALDNREARVFVNAACARVGRAWFDGGIEVLQGVARGFAPPKTACYECTMSRVDWELLNKRRSCSLLARRALANRGTPTTPTTASIIGAVQAQEAVKYLHGRPSLLGRGFVFDGAEHASYGVTYPLSPECPWHEPPITIEAFQNITSDTSLREIADMATTRLGRLDAIDLARDIVGQFTCAPCRRSRDVWRNAESIGEEDARCPHCGAESAPTFIQSIPAGSPWLDKSPRQLGLPEWEIVWARAGDQFLGLEIAGDSPFPAR
jgi:adenylyltransferase/sulfurtransferase